MPYRLSHTPTKRHNRGVCPTVSVRCLAVSTTKRTSKYCAFFRNAAKTSFFQYAAKALCVPQGGLHFAAERHEAPRRKHTTRLVLLLYRTMRPDSSCLPCPWVWSSLRPSCSCSVSRCSRQTERRSKSTKSGTPSQSAKSTRHRSAWSTR